MKIFDTLLGRTKPVRANLDAIFSLPSAAISMEASDGVTLSGQGGVCWKPPAGQPDAEKEIRGLVPTAISSKDSYGFEWFVINSIDPEELVTKAHMINSALSDAGWGPQLLCSVFKLSKGYFVYLFKRGTFYPFVPSGHEQRDTEAELHLRAIVGEDLPIERDLTRWFPLWDLPFS